MNERNDTSMTGGQRTSAMAVTSLIMGVLTIPLVWCCFGYLTGPLAVIFGIIGLIAVKNGEASAASKVMAWAGIIMASVSMIGYLILYMTVLGGTLYGGLSQVPSH